MLKNKIKLKLIILIILLIITSFTIIVLKGNEYTVKYDSSNKDLKAEELNIDYDHSKDAVKLINKKVENGIIILTYKGNKPGKTAVTVADNETGYVIFVLYVHKFNIITYNSYFGKSTGDIIIPISIIILLAFSLHILINKYKKSIKQNMYQYKNVSYLGIIIFISITLLQEIHRLFNYNGLIETIEGVISSVNFFSIILLPLAFITSILVTISNLILLKREGFTWRNMLGIILGLLFCFMTILPEIMNNILQTSTFINVHNEQGITLYIFEFIETAIYLVVAYLECILLGTIILGFKSAKHIPEQNKDYIIILGCMIKKDGTLTNLLKSRVDRAIEFRNIQKENTGKDLIFIPSGGQGKNEIISEAQAMKNYLLEQGIKEKNILIEDKSTNTLENIKFSNKIIKSKTNNPNIAFSTTNYHVFRAGTIASSLNIKVEGIGAKTKTYFWINAFIREFIATLVSEKKKHIIIITSLLLLSIIIISIIYLSNII